MKDVPGQRRKLELEGIELRGSGYSPGQMDGLCGQMGPVVEGGPVAADGALPPGLSTPRTVWKDEAGSRYVMVDEEGIPKARRYAVGTPAGEEGGMPEGFVSMDSPRWQARRSTRYQPKAEELVDAVRSRPCGPPGEGDGAQPKEPAGAMGQGGGDGGLLSSPWMGVGGGAVGGMLGGLFSPTDGKSPLQSILQGGVSGAVTSALTGAIGSLLGGMMKADDTDSLAKQVAAKFALPTLVAVPSMVEKFFSAPAGGGEPVCRGRLSPAPKVFVEGQPMGLIGAEVVDRVPSKYLPAGAPKVTAGGMPMAVSSGLVEPLVPPGPPEPTTAKVHAATVKWAAPKAPEFHRKDGKKLEKGDSDLEPPADLEPAMLEHLTSGKVSASEIQQFMQEVGMPDHLADGFDLSLPQDQIEFFRRHGGLHFWDPAAGYSASLNEFFAPRGFFGSAINEGILAAGRLGRWSGAFELGTPAWPGAGTGSMWWAPDRIGNFSISRLFVEHDAVYGRAGIVDAEGGAWLNALRQNPNLVGLVYGTAAVMATTINGIFDPDVGYAPWAPKKHE